MDFINTSELINLLVVLGAAAAIANTVKRFIMTPESMFSIRQLIDLLFHYFEQYP